MLVYELFLVTSVCSEVTHLEFVYFVRKLNESSNEKFQKINKKHDIFYINKIKFAYV